MSIAKHHQGGGASCTPSGRTGGREERITLGAPERAVAAEVLRRARDLFGRHLVGVVVFGSRARGDACVGSDLDLLVILDEGVPITRELYRRWDAVAIRNSAGGQGGGAMASAPPGAVHADVHFARLPPPGEVEPGIWADVACEGIVLEDPHGRLEACLERYRRAIGAGRLQRRESHGHPYWVPGPGEEASGP